VPSLPTASAATRSLISALQPEEVLVLEAVWSRVYRGRLATGEMWRESWRPERPGGWESWARLLILPVLSSHLGFSGRLDGG
jgi:hypothetical protein